MGSQSVLFMGTLEQDFDERNNPFSRKGNQNSFGFCLFRLTNVDCVWTLRTFTNFELNRVSITDFTSHLGLMNEEIFSAFLFYEAEALYSIKPLYCTCWHCSYVKIQLIEVTYLLMAKNSSFVLPIAL